MDSSCDFGIDFHRKINAFCSQFYTIAKKSDFNIKIIKFPMEIEPKIA